MSVKNSNGTIGNRTRNLPVCSAVPQPTAPPRVQARAADKIDIIIPSRLKFIKLLAPELFFSF